MSFLVDIFDSDLPEHSFLASWCHGGRADSVESNRTPFRASQVDHPVDPVQMTCYDDGWLVEHLTPRLREFIISRFQAELITEPKYAPRTPFPMPFAAFRQLSIMSRPSRRSGGLDREVRGRQVLAEQRCLRQRLHAAADVTEVRRRSHAAGALQHPEVRALHVPAPGTLKCITLDRG